MKKAISRIISILCVLSLALTVAGCGTKIVEESVWVEGDPVYESTDNTVSDTAGEADKDSSKICILIKAIRAMFIRILKSAQIWICFLCLRAEKT